MPFQFSCAFLFSRYMLENVYILYHVSLQMDRMYSAQYGGNYHVCTCSYRHEIVYISDHVSLKMESTNLTCYHGNHRLIDCMFILIGGIQYMVVYV